MTACDAVLSVSNTNVHIAAGLGLPTWVLVPKGRGKLWFWFYEGDYSPWYSRLRVCRQKMDETWEETVARVTPEIAAFLSSVEPRGKTGP